MIVENLLRSVRRSSVEKIDKLKILTVCRNHEKYISLLCHNTPHAFYVLPNHPWNILIEPPPDSLYKYEPHVGAIDCVICYDRAEGYVEAQGLAHQLHVPLLLVDMCSEKMVRPHHILEELRIQDPPSLHRNPNIRISVTAQIQKSWNVAEQSLVIPLAVDAGKFETPPIDEPVLCIDNNTTPQVAAEVARRVAGAYPVIPTDHDDENISVKQSRYFFNTNSSITVKVLEAMAASNIVICLQNEETSMFLENGRVGILIDSLDGLKSSIDSMEADEPLRLEMSKLAREKVVKNHSLEEFSSKWSSAFAMIKSSFYTPNI